MSCQFVFRINLDKMDECFIDAFLSNCDVYRTFFYSSGCVAGPLEMTSADSDPLIHK